ncbi:MAG: flagellar basal body-associated FliL family protein [Bacillota bacterium]|nr:flagellar basal body-associated FliL family protein [Bacillota bacterium]MDW7683005.1 flagellar basal body-associated FliL family protein [Bacillota bacterium]
MTNETAPTEKKKRKLSKTHLLLALVAVLALLGVSIGVYNVAATNEGLNLKLPGRSADRSEAPPLYKLYGPQDFTVNLSDNDQRRYLKATVTLAFENKKLAKELDQRSAQIRDLIIEVLRGNTAADVADESGTQALRETLIQELNDTLVNGEIKDIYFTDFLVQ